MWENKKVAVILPTYREKNSIRSVIGEFFASGYVDEIIVVDNNAEDGTREEVAKTAARLVVEKRQGYGAAIQAGIKSTKADLLIISEPDGTFDGQDVLKLLAYSRDFEMVFGSRTHQSLIHSGSEMHFTRRILDALFGKLISVLFLSTTLTDVGCTLRLTSRDAFGKIANECKSSSALFATQWLLLACKNKVRFIEIPVNFRPRVGRSTLTNTLIKQSVWAIIIFFYIFRVWIAKLTGSKLSR